MGLIQLNERVPIVLETAIQKAHELSSGEAEFNTILGAAMSAGFLQCLDCTIQMGSSTFPYENIIQEALALLKHGSAKSSTRTLDEDQIANMLRQLFMFVLKKSRDLSENNAALQDYLLFRYITSTFLSQVETRCAFNKDVSEIEEIIKKSIAILKKYSGDTC